MAKTTPSKQKCNVDAIQGKGKGESKSKTKLGAVFAEGGNTSETMHFLRERSDSDSTLQSQRSSKSSQPTILPIDQVKSAMKTVNISQKGHQAMMFLPQKLQRERSVTAYVHLC